MNTQIGVRIRVMHLHRTYSEKLKELPAARLKAICFTKIMMRISVYAIAMKKPAPMMLGSECLRR